jgi:response regulator RpfG family c-di-GMP phosphodiesterase
MTKKILFVDDDPNLLAAFQRNLRKQFTFDCASSGPEAIDLVKAGEQYAVVVCDMRMPGMDGVKTLETIRSLAPDTVRIMLTGNADQQTAVDAVNRGQIFRFLNKPCPPDVLVPAIDTALKQFELIRVEKELLEGTLMGSVKALGDLLAMVAPHAHSQAECLRAAIGPFAEAAGAGPLWELQIGAMLSPIGCASLPAGVLRKISVRAALTHEEQAMLDRVPKVGYELLKSIPRLDTVAKIVLYQRKHFDGTGFPGDFCAGEQIPAGARMLKILDDRLQLEAEGVVRQHALDHLKSRTGIHDPALLDLCFKCLPEVLNRTPVGARPPIAVSIAEIAPGQRLAKDIATPGGLVLVSAGHRLTSIMVERIRNMAELGDVKEPFMIVDEPPL